MCSTKKSLTTPISRPILKQNKTNQTTLGPLSKDCVFKCIKSECVFKYFKRK